MIKLEVGKNFPLTKMREGLLFDLKEEGFHLLAGMRNIEDFEVSAFRKGRINFHLSYVNDIIFLILEIEGVIGVSDIPFHIGLTRAPLDILNEKKFPIWLFLIDIKDNTLKAMRLIGLSEEFSTILKQLIEKQMEKSFDKNEYDKNLIKIYNTFSPMDLKKMSTAHYISGH